MTDSPVRGSSKSRKLYWLWLSLCLYPGSPAADLLFDYFGSDPEAVFNAGREELEKIEDLPSKTVDRLCCKHMGKAEEIRNYCLRHGIGLLTPDDEGFPDRLRGINRKPLLFYYRGRLPNFNEGLYIAAVGTRSFSEYGKREGYAIAYDLARAGVTVVSGMARGIDSVCHRAALDAGGSTVAVLGCGIDRAYPPENRALMEEIVLKGVVLTEYPPFTAPVGAHFPVRNRIISGLSQGTFVVEGSETSGAMITAALAEEQGRIVFALPGQVGELESCGTNALIQGSAVPVTGALDILKEFDGIYPEIVRPAVLSRGIRPRFSGGSPAETKKRPPRAASRASGSGEARFPGQENAGGRDKVRWNAPPDAPIPELREEPPVFPEELFRPTDASGFAPAKKKADTRGTPGREPPALGAYPPDSDEGILLRRLYDGGEMTADQLADERFAVHQVLSMLTVLELEGAVLSLPGGKFTVAGTFV